MTAREHLQCCSSSWIILLSHVSAFCHPSLSEASSLLTSHHFSSYLLYFPRVLKFRVYALRGIVKVGFSHLGFNFEQLSVFPTSRSITSCSRNNRIPISLGQDFGHRYHETNVSNVSLIEFCKLFAKQLLNLLTMISLVLMGFFFSFI